MEKRHYFKLDSAINNITSLYRITKTGGKEDNPKTEVTGYVINDTEYTLGEDSYDMLINISQNLEYEPFKGDKVTNIINGTDSEDHIEVYTKDGLYLYLKGLDLYVKDFLEFTPKSYQGKMFRDLTGSTDIPSNIRNLIENMIKNIKNPKEFRVIREEVMGKGVYGHYDDVEAMIDNTYYVNSSNEYDPYEDKNNIWGSQWVIPRDIYNPRVDGIEKTIPGSRLREDIWLRSNKLLYLMTYTDMEFDDDYQYLSTGLIYLKNITINSVNYQIYLNPNYLYTLGGDMYNDIPRDTIETIKIRPNRSLKLLGPFETYTDASGTTRSLVGKVVKVW